MLILLPPSEGKALGGTGAWRPSSGEHGLLESHRAAVTEALAVSEPVPLGLSGDRRVHALAANAAIVGSPCLPAHDRYDGVVLQSLSPRTLSQAARSRAGASVHFVSALGGLFAWGDPVPWYRLKMGARLDGIGRLDRYWRAALAARIAALGRPVIDLLPNEHAAAAPGAGLRWLRVELVGPGGRAAGHAGKSAKGLLCRDLLESADPEDVVRSWQGLGFRTRCVIAGT